MSSALKSRSATRNATPFHIYGDRHLPAPRATNTRLPEPEHTCNLPSWRGERPSVLWQRKKKRQNALSSLLVGGLLLCLTGFVLSPLPLQKQLFSAFGLGLNKPPATEESTLHPLPVQYDYVSSSFGPRWGRQHQGIDLAAQSGKPIHATSDGVVLHSGWEAGYGKSVVIDHGQGVQTRYAHCAKVLAVVGETVQKGAIIGKVGSTGHSTGPHLHFEVIVKGERKNPAWYYRFEQTPRWEKEATAEAAKNSQQKTPQTPALADLMKLWRAS